MEAHIDEVLGLSIDDLRSRLRVKGAGSSGYLKSECLAHLMRRGRRTGDQPVMNAVLPVLLSRCRANLLVKVPDNAFPGAADVRQTILDDLAEFFAIDGTPESKNELDYFECRFNSALRTLRIDTIRAAERRHEKLQFVDAKPPDEIEEAGPYDDVLARIAEAFRVPPTQGWDAMRPALEAAIKALPRDERKAVVLVHLLEYKEESEDPAEETAATRCRCSGRTIRNRLTRAAKKLAEFKEYLEIL